MHIIVADKYIGAFCDVLSNTKYLSEFITLRFSEEGIYSQGMTLDHCSIYEFKMNEDWFDEYEWDSEDSPTITISTDILAKILATRQPSQYMVLQYIGKPDKITIKFTSTRTKSKKHEFPKEFLVPLMDVDEQTLSIPDIEYSADFSIGSKALMTTNEQLSLFNETLSIHCSEEVVEMKANGNDGELTVTLFNDKCEYVTEYAIEEDLDLKLDFSIKHFQTFCRFLKVADNVTLSFKNDYPMKFEYVTDSDLFKLVFYLAPKINDETN